MTKCPNCDYEVEDKRVCPECGYTTGYNHAADKLFLEKGYSRMEDFAKAHVALSKMFRGVTYMHDTLILPESYRDADRQNIKKKISKINKTYNVNYDYQIR